VACTNIKTARTKYGYVVGVLFAALWGLLFPSVGSSDMIGRVIEEDQVILDRAYDILEGEVTSVEHLKNDKCLTAYYQLRVSRSQKGNVRVGDVVDIGVNVYTLPIERGDQHIVVLQKPNLDLINACSTSQYSSGFNFAEALTLFPNAVSLFKIDPDRGMFEARVCRDYRNILLETYFVEQGINVENKTTADGDVCRELNAQLKMLRSRLGITQ
jgi:hypothetical protein